MLSNDPKPPQPGTPGPSKRALLLEDDELLAQTLKKLLKFQQWDVTAVQNGAEGLRKIMTDNFDVIICDLMMPTMPGDMFYLAVEKVKPFLCERFIFVTGDSNNPRVSSFLAKTNGAVLYKPVRVADLVKMISTVIEKARPFTKAKPS